MSRCYRERVIFELDGPIAIQRGVAVYKEISGRTVTIPVSDKYAGALSGPVTVQYIESAEEGGRTLAETQAVLR